MQIKQTSIPNSKHQWLFRIFSKNTRPWSQFNHITGLQIAILTPPVETTVLFLQMSLSLWSRAKCNRQHYKLFLKSACITTVYRAWNSLVLPTTNNLRNVSDNTNLEWDQSIQEAEKFVKRRKARISSRNFSLMM